MDDIVFWIYSDDGGGGGVPVFEEDLCYQGE